MATLTVLKFDTVAGAKATIQLLDRLQACHLITIEDAAAIFWPIHTRQPNTCRIHHLAGSGKLMPVFWHLLFEFLFLPGTGAPASSPKAASDGAFAEFGFDPSFVKGARNWITPGTSAAFVFSTGPVIHHLAETLRNTTPPCGLMVTHLAEVKAKRLREVFAMPTIGFSAPMRRPAPKIGWSSDSKSTPPRI